MTHLELFEAIGFAVAGLFVFLVAVRFVVESAKWLRKHWRLYILICIGAAVFAIIAKESGWDWVFAIYG